MLEIEFILLGLGKINSEVRKLATQVIAAGKDLSQITDEGTRTDVEDLVSLYQEMKREEFLRVSFSKLSAEEKLKWLEPLIEELEAKREFGDLGMFTFGWLGLPISALFQAYRDKDEKVREPAEKILKQVLGEVLLADPRGLFTRQNINAYTEVYVKELSQLQEISQPYKITEEKLKGTDTVLKSFLFHYGGNIYVFSYERNGQIMHTLIDTGDRQYKPSILRLFKKNGIEPANIERILLTHHHPDHSGLVDILCLVSGAKVLVHPNFGDVIEGKAAIEASELKRWKAVGLMPSKLGRYVKYLPLPKEDRVRDIGGVNFPVLGKVDIGDGAELEILGLPEGDSFTHTADQLIFLYTPMGSDFKPTHGILFSGDLWLMRGPGAPEETLRELQIYKKVIRERRRIVDFREQDRKAKNALKEGFDRIEVAPSHGGRFLGSKIIGYLLAGRDLLVKLGYNENANKAILDTEEEAPRIEKLKEEAYQGFIKELELWLAPLEERGLGCSLGEVSQFLLRIYKEQSDGTELVEQDRKERRIALKEILARLKEDREQSEELRELAKCTLEEIETGN